ncbi:glycosyltransferase [Sinomonas terrae]|uniref:D-inositol 3-phosphate glycosyltransferase n=1 Tax=Sinomonas terrae TaxID=2908838 RepID=A0ABS9U542_9MICC|nr:glycosyltransferase [Sinomonas terrae]MCH6471809.1 glycosyltransferase [Sinomonas terrae]
MKILHVTECVGGGVGRAIDQIPGLVSSHQHYLLSVRPDAQKPSGKGFARSMVLPDGHFARIMAVRRAVSELDPDVIHAHSSWAGLYVRARRIPGRVVYQPHGYALELGGNARRLAVATVEWLLARRSSSVAVLSPHEFDVAGRLNANCERVFVPNFPTIESSLRNTRTRLRRVVMVGRLSSQKDPTYFASLKQSVNAHDDTIDFRWIGDGDPASRSRLQRIGVTVTGWLDTPELVAELECASLYAHTGRYEGFPLSVLDAAACDLPVVARAIPAFSGSPVAQFETLAQHAGAILKYFSQEEDLRRDLKARNVELLEFMNAGRQQAALHQLYGITDFEECYAAAKEGRP